MIASAEQDRALIWARSIKRLKSNRLVKQLPTLAPVRWVRISSFVFAQPVDTNVYWYFGDVVVVAVGCFADPSFPAPTVLLYGKNRTHWLPHFDVPLAYAGNRESEQENAD